MKLIGSQKNDEETRSPMNIMLRLIAHMMQTVFFRDCVFLAWLLNVVF